MLDYSDEELPCQPFRRRGHSQSGETGNSLTGFSVHLRRGRGEHPYRNEQISFSDLATRTRSIFRGFKNRSSGLIMPTSNQPTTNPFTVNQFIIDGSTDSKSRLLDFERNIKSKSYEKDPNGAPDIRWEDEINSDGSVLNSSAINKFSSDYEDHPDSFFMSMKTIVILAQFFAVLPLTGVEGTNFKSLRFKWIHVKTAYWAFSFLGSLFLFVCSASYGLQYGIFTQSASDIVFFACGIVTSLLMLILSRNWKKLNEEFADIEDKLRKYGYPKKIGLKFKISIILFLLTALVEHLLSKLTDISKTVACARRKDDFFSLSESFFLNQYNAVFSLTPYSLWVGILVVVIQFLTTTLWNFTDLFLSLISWAIAERFKQIHNFLDRVHGQEKPISFWKEVREDYNNLSVLTKRIDSHIRNLMLISMGNNLFFVCLQLLQSLRNKLGPIKLLYFFWSFGFLVLRTSFVAFSAARINDESKEPKTVLYSVPSKNYSAEVRRFLTQLTTNEVALTGCGFFSITRSLILTITGTVITYEIVLVQFSNDESGEELKNNQTICLNR